MRRSTLRTSGWHDDQAAPAGRATGSFNRITRRWGIAVVAALVYALAAPAAHADGQVRAGAAVVDGTYRVGNSAGQYASTRDQGYGDVDPHAQQVKNKASYGVQSRESVRAIVVRGADGRYVAIVSDDHYIPQDALWRRTAQLVSAGTHGLINEKNLTMAVTHNHSSPSYSSFDWGVWTFQDVFDFRFFDYYAHQNAAAVEKALANMHNVRVSATVSHFDSFQKNPMGPTWADDGSPAGFPRPYTDHDLSVVYFDNVDNPGHPKALATLANIGQHPEMLEGYDLISGEWPSETERFVDRTAGGVTMITQNATGTSEVEEDRWHPIHKRELFNHAQYNQMEWGARQLASSIVSDVNSIRKQRANPDTRPTAYGGSSYHDRFVPWMRSFPVAMDDRWFPGPVSHPYPGVSSCRTDPAFQGDPRLPVVGLPDCQDMPWGTSLSPVTTLGGASPGISTNTFEALGIPVPENYSAPSTGGLEDTVGVHMQAFRLGPILFTVCSCEQWVDQAYNIKTRTDVVPGNEYLGYDATSARAHPSERCTRNGDGTYKDDGSGTGTWTCSLADLPAKAVTKKFPDNLIEHMRAQVLNDASRWDDPTCTDLGCGPQAESEPTDLKKVFGNFTHDDTSVRGGHAQSRADAERYGYKLTVTIAMSNDYNGYIASYREFMDRDHYRKALTGWGPHSSDYYATRLSQMGHALKGDSSAQQAIDQQTDPQKASPAWAPLVAKEVADQNHEEAKVKAVGEVASQGVKAYATTIPNDGGTDAELVQPKSISRFDASTFTWDGGNNYTEGGPELGPVRRPERRASGDAPVPGLVRGRLRPGRRGEWHGRLPAWRPEVEVDVDVRGVRLALPAGRSAGEELHGHPGWDVPVRGARHMAKVERGCSLHAHLALVRHQAVARDHGEPAGARCRRARHVRNRPVAPNRRADGSPDGAPAACPRRRAGQVHGRSGGLPGRGRGSEGNGGALPERRPRLLRYEH